MTHGAEGVSKGRMGICYNDRMKSSMSYKIARDACTPNKILEVLTELLQNSMLLSQPYRDLFGGKTTDYYIYSEIKRWAIKQLFAEFMIRGKSTVILDYMRK